MKKTVLAISVLLIGVLASEAALADRRGRHHRGNVHFGIAIGAPLAWGAYWGPRYYHPAPYYYYPAPLVVAPAAPTVYIEQAPAAAAPAPQGQGYWYYCDESQTYYPYVQQCPGGWQRVVPQSPPG